MKSITWYSAMYSLPCEWHELLWDFSKRGKMDVRLFFKKFNFFLRPIDSFIEFFCCFRNLLCTIKVLSTYRQAVEIIPRQCLLFTARQKRLLHNLAVPCMLNAGDQASTIWLSIRTTSWVICTRGARVRWSHQCLLSLWKVLWHNSENSTSGR